MPDQGYNAINPLMEYLLELDGKLNGHLGLEISVKGSPGVTDASNLLRGKDENFHS